MLAMQPGRALEAFELQWRQVGLALQLAQTDPRDLAAWELAAGGAQQTALVAEYVGPDSAASVDQNWSCCFFDAPRPKSGDAGATLRYAGIAFQRALVLVRSNSGPQAMAALENARVALRDAFVLEPHQSDIEMTLGDVDRYGALLARKTRDFRLAARRAFAASDQYDKVAEKAAGSSVARYMSMLSRIEAAEALVGARDGAEALAEALLAASEAIEMVVRDPTDARARGLIVNALIFAGEGEILIAEQRFRANEFVGKNAELFPLRSLREDNENQAEQHASCAMAYLALAEDLLSAMESEFGSQVESKYEREKIESLRVAAARLFEKAIAGHER